MALCNAQNGAGQHEEAEATMWRCIKTTIKKKGIRDPEVVNLRIVLQGWLREWGEVEKAERLKKETERLIEMYAEEDALIDSMQNVELWI